MSNNVDLSGIKFAAGAFTRLVEKGGDIAAWLYAGYLIAKYIFEGPTPPPES